MSDYLLLAGAAFLAGIMNAVAGGGTLVTFPALVGFLGGGDAAEVLANGTSTVALVPGALAAVWGYRRELAAAEQSLRLMLPPALLGGAVGSVLVVVLPPKVFHTIVPWLILATALLFTVQPAMSRWAAGHRLAIAPQTRNVLAATFLFLLGIYGGYFGGGAGIVTLAGLAMLGMNDIHQMNGLKTIIVGAMNAVAAGVFIWHRNVDWSIVAVMAPAAILGGLFGASAARRVDRGLMRRVVAAIGFAVAAYYFYRQWT